MNTRKIPHAFLAISLALYATSFLLPTCWVDPLFSSNSEVSMIGMEAFLASSPLACGSAGLIAWLANPLFWLGLMSYFSAARPGALPRALPSLISASAFLFGVLGAWVFRRDIIGLQIGYFVWLASFPLLCLAHFCLVLESRKLRRVAALR